MKNERSILKSENFFHEGKELHLQKFINSKKISPLKENNLVSRKTIDRSLKVKNENSFREGKKLNLQKFVNSKKISSFSKKKKQSFREKRTIDRSIDPSKFFSRRKGVFAWLKNLLIREESFLRKKTISSREKSLKVKSVNSFRF